MKCPKCGKMIDLALEVENWSREFAHEVPQGEPAMLNCVCKDCEAGGIWLEMIPYTETLDIESPLGIVKMPNLGQDNGASVTVDENKQNEENKG